MVTPTMLQSKYNAPAISAMTAATFEREAMIEAHLPKVKYIADRIGAKLPPSVEREDLYGAGVIGLIDAADRFDPARGIAFTTFAELRVRGAILDSLRELDFASRSARRRAKEVQAAFAQLEKERGRPATEDEVAAHLGVSLPKLQEILGELTALNVSELDERDEETGLSALDSVQDTADSPLESFEKNERRQKLSESIDRLPERERQVIALYYLEELTMKEIGVCLGVTESRVSQLRTQAIVRLRSNFSN